MKKNNIGAILLIVGAGVLLYTAFFLYKQYNKLKNICFSVIKTTIKNISLEGVTLTIYLKVKNISDIDIKLKLYNLDVYVNKKPVAKIPTTDIIKINHGGYNTISFDITIPLKQLGENVIEILTGIYQDSISGGKQDVLNRVIIDIDSDIFVDLGGIKVDKYKYTDKYTLKDLLTPSGTEC